MWLPRSSRAPRARETVWRLILCLPAVLLVACVLGPPFCAAMSPVRSKRKASMVANQKILAKDPKVTELGESDLTVYCFHGPGVTSPVKYGKAGPSYEEACARMRSELADPEHATIEFVVQCHQLRFAEYYAESMIQRMLKDSQIWPRKSDYSAESALMHGVPKLNAGDGATEWFARSTCAAILPYVLALRSPHSGEVVCPLTNVLCDRTQAGGGCCS